jgi:nucleotide-binding universal stress UspA family protein
MRAHQIVVGADGSAAGAAAVRWAAREAAERSLGLRIVHAFDWNRRAERDEAGREGIDIDRHRADVAAATALGQARSVSRNLLIEVDAVIGDAVPRLLDACAGSELAVVGTRGRAGLSGLLLGSVSVRIAALAPCPVVVVRGRPDVRTGPVAVGVGGHPTADPALEAAFDMADRRACPLAVVYGYRPLHGDLPVQDTAQRLRLDDLIAPWRDKYPRVPVDILISHGEAATALVRLSAGAQLVVVGDRGRGLLADALLASTTELLRHCECPVLITRPGAHR